MIPIAIKGGAMVSETQVRTRLTAEEFAEFVQRPENVGKCLELVRGEVVELPAPTKRHGVLTFNLGRILGNYLFQRGKGYATSNDAGVILERDPDTVRGPDIALYDDAETYEDLHPKYGEVPPLLAVEILSPGDRMGQVMRKVKDYLKNGVAIVWVIDPETRNVVVHRPGREPLVVEEIEVLTGEDIFPDLQFRVGEVFLLPGQKEAPSAS
jgi:Uma2 family endonuclease